MADDAVASGRRAQLSRRELQSRVKLLGGKANQKVRADGLIEGRRSAPG